MSIVVLGSDGRDLFEARGAPSPPGHRLTRESTGHYKPVGPVVLRRDVGAIFVLMLVGIMAALFYLKHNERELGGVLQPLMVRWFITDQILSRTHEAFR